MMTAGQIKWPIPGFDERASFPNAPSGSDACQYVNRSTTVRSTEKVLPILIKTCSFIRIRRINKIKVVTFRIINVLNIGIAWRLRRT